MTYVLFSKNCADEYWHYELRTSNPELVKSHIKFRPRMQSWFLVKGKELSVHIEKTTVIKSVSFDDS